MKHRNVIVKSIGIYYPDNVVDNEYFIEHFKLMGIDVSTQINRLGREKRYLSEGEETSLTMAYESSKKAIEKAGINSDDIDMIVFVSETPEYTSPSNALKLNQMLEAKNAHIVYDMNSNCTGMLNAIDLISTYIKMRKNINKVLIVGSLLISSVVSEKDPITYSNVGDSSAATILEVVNEEKERGFVDASYFTNSSYHNSILMPACGYSNIYEDDIPKDEKKWKWCPFDFGFLSEDWNKLIRNLLAKHDLKPKDVDHYIFSQFSKPDTIETLKKLEVDTDNFTFVGNEYGYTGPTSPILALDRAIENGKVSEGTSVILCSVGSGFTMTALLIKF